MQRLEVSGAVRYIYVIRWQRVKHSGLALIFISPQRRGCFPMFLSAVF
jgi:hypothetical protein